MDYKEKYNKLVEAIKVLQEANPSDEGIQNWVNDNVPELAESEDERIRGELIEFVEFVADSQSNKEEWLAWLEKQGESYTKRDVDDAYLEGMAFAKDELEKQKPTWSEEDEVRLQACIDTLQANSIMGKVDTINTNWLKSLKQRHTWKPSKEQMDAMQMAVSYFDYSWASKEQKLLESLYKDLKRL